MKKLILVMWLLTCAVAQAQESWQPMSWDAITRALTDRKVQYRQGWQVFHASGRTLYNAGQDSWGYWAVRGEQYCSMWPPSDIWACYDMARSGAQLRFIGAAGDTTDAVYADE